MRKKISILISTILLSFLVTQPSQVLAAETSQNDTNYVINEHLVENSLLRGTSAPTGSSYVDLSNNTYNYSVDFTVRLFTNSLFSGVSNISVKVGTISVDKNIMQNSSENITVTLYKSDGTKVSSESIGLSGGTAKFTGLSTSTKYYVGFTKQNDTQTYKFSGTISK